MTKPFKNVDSGADVTSEADVTSALNAAERDLGVVTAVVNCAGVAVAQKSPRSGKTLSKRGPHSLEDFARVLSVNTVGSFNVARLAAERMVRVGMAPAMLRRLQVKGGKQGTIINTASVAAFDGQIGQVFKRVCQDQQKQ
eukprot:scaffold2096_cov221-Pinguiococcus_pyrenoidosus.AAC.4